MGLTYGESFIHAQVVHPNELFFLDRNPDKEELIRSLSTHPLRQSVDSILSEIDLLVVSVKPQDFSSLAGSLRKYLHQDQIILSIMAGVKVRDIQQLLGIPKVVRAMPNLPAQVGQGMTVFTTADEVSRKELLSVQNLLNTTGKTLFTDDERLIDTATAVSGSGPAFVFYYMAAMMESAREMGFSESESQLLVQQTFWGALHLLQRNNLSCEDWIKRVSSKGGTTEAAIHTFQEVDLSQKIQEGLFAAFQRAERLSESILPDKE